jgi:hypothetical protein
LNPNHAMPQFSVPPQNDLFANPSLGIADSLRHDTIRKNQNDEKSSGLSHLKPLAVHLFY